jgi:acetyl-CoA synthetase
MPATSPDLRRLLSPATIAVAGGQDAAEAIRQCRRIGFAGPLWAINPGRATLAGVPCFPDVDALPAAPDACFVAVPHDATIRVVEALARRGAGGAVCYASGFAEAGAAGVDRQRRLVDAARAMPLLGPNCYGFVNHLDACALWPDRAGGERVRRGVALLTQSGNIALNLSMQRRHLPIAFLASLGNQAQLDVAAMIRALLADERISAIGLHVEGLPDVPAFSAAALEALARGVPIVVLKTGLSARGAALAASHTSALAGPRASAEALFERVGALRVDDLGALVETLKLLHACGPVRGRRVAALGCSGGEASLAADLGEAARLEFPALPPAVAQRLAATLGPEVALGNPLDYHTQVWGRRDALVDCFAAMQDAPVDAALLVLDVPDARLPGEDALPPGWAESLDAWIAAHAGRAVPALVVATLPELMPPAAAAALLEAGIAPMQGLRETLRALRAAADSHALREQAGPRHPVAATPPLRSGRPRLLTEVEAKRALARCGLALPGGHVVRNGAQALAAAASLGYPVVLKAVGDALAHKTELGLVRLDLREPEELRAAHDALREAPGATGVFLVERMQRGVVAELIVGVRRDDRFGLQLTIGAGGVLVELLDDAVTLLLPVTRADVERALRSLRCHALLAGHRGRPAADLGALVEAIGAVVRFAARHADRLLELDVNPLLALPRGAVAADALVRLVD